MDYLKNQFAQHLATLGFDLQSPKQVVLQKLRQRMGEQRFAEFQKRGSHSAAGQEEFYTLFQDIIEGNLMRSLDTCATLDASFSLYEKCLPWLGLEEGLRVTELGCWTGGLASFVALRHPHCSVVGVDFAQKVVDACKAHYRLPNLDFKQWNYRWGKPEDLEPADVLLCSMGVVHHLPDNTVVPDPAAVRRTKEYLLQRDHAIGYFSLWRSAAKEGATLFAVLRLGLFPRFLAWLDASQQTGWTPLLDQLWHADMSGEKSALPGLVFEAKTSPVLTEDAILDRWAWFRSRSHIHARLEGGTALAAFRALQPKTVLATRDYRREGAMTRDEVGLAGGTGYVFTCDVASHFRLLLISRQRANELAAKVSAKGSSLPITDEAVLQDPAAPASVPAGVFSSGKPAASSTSSACCSDGQVGGTLTGTIAGGSFSMAGASPQLLDDWAKP